MATRQKDVGEYIKKASDESNRKDIQSKIQFNLGETRGKDASRNKRGFFIIILLVLGGKKLLAD